ncbi:MAG: hypothetical protein EHM16_14920 [Betaproteobacteria bacterium]|nr:MAG: hypothetical protein EHM16_14920 [Betaproteobacteria bacterium]
MNRTARRTFDQAAGTLNAAFEQSGPFPGQEVTPPLLADAIRQCLDVCQRVDADGSALPLEDVDELGTHVLECLSDLGLWAYQLQADAARTVIEDLALDMAHWIVGHGGHIAVLEPVVNALARQANATQDPAQLAALFDRACGIIAYAAPGLTAGTDAASLQPWLTLHFNCAIIATRTQQPELMNAAYDLLETHLPRHCAAFYEEGVRESAKPVYGEHVGELLRQRLAKWTTRH